MTVLSAVGLLFGLIVILSLIGALRPYKISTGGMRPTLSPGDHFYMERLSYRFRSRSGGKLLFLELMALGELLKMPGYLFNESLVYPETNWNCVRAVYW